MNAKTSEVAFASSTMHTSQKKQTLKSEFLARGYDRASVPHGHRAVVQEQVRSLLVEKRVANAQDAELPGREVRLPFRVPRPRGAHENELAPSTSPSASTRIRRRTRTNVRSEERERDVENSKSAPSPRAFAQRGH